MSDLTNNAARLPRQDSRLAASHGFTVAANDGDVGEVETPLFPPAGAEPDFLVVRLASDQASFVVVPVQVIESVDPDARLIQLDASRKAVAEMHGEITLEH